MEGNVFRKLADYVRLAAAYTRLNLGAQLEYRGAFFSQVFAMFINDIAWVLFWMFFFTRFPILRGWGLNDVLLLWAVTASGFGIAYSLMGNAHQLAPLIVNGELDIWMSHPRAVLPHLLLGRSIPSAWGDAIFGYAVFLVFIRPSLPQLAMFTILTFSVAGTFVGLGILAGSLSFYMGNASSLADEWKFAVISFSTYPPSLFDGVVKLLLFTLIPAGFVSYIPVEALRTMSIEKLFLAALGAIGMLALATGVFYYGLRRYESGNLISMNG
jgi:ABC-2 type transport system permease protein